jgi:hypothetical protein
MSSIHSSEPVLFRKSGAAWAPAAILAAAVLFAGPMVAAQQAQPSAQAAAGAPVKKSPRHRARQPEPPPPPVEQPAPDPPQPELPHWPVNETPSKPSVTWDSGGLKIQANNSSLHDILNQVSAHTGAKVEGIGADERVFGEFGPGTARDVVSQLLHGSSYNVLMIGDQGAGTPRQIVLSARRSGNSQQQANRPGQPEEQQPDEDVPDQPEDNDQSGQPPIINNGRPPMQMVPQGPPGVPGAPRTPQQVLQELQQRQQQIQDQQQQQQQQQQPPH